MAADDKPELPEGTDKIGRRSAAENAPRDTDIVTSDTALVTEREIPAPQRRCRARR